MKFQLIDGLPFVKIELIHENKKITLANVLIDTGSASTIISTDLALELDLGPSPNDELFRIRGVGGSEYVYEKQIETIKLESVTVKDFIINIGAMDYGLRLTQYLV